MLKLKKILSSITCLVVMLAFVWTIGCEFGLIPQQKPRTEISPSNQHTTISPLLVAEERDDCNDHYDALNLIPQLSVSIFVFFISTHFLLPIVFKSDKLIQENSLYIPFRSLRL